MLLLDELFGLGSGFVLNFSNQTFQEFFASELGIDIYHPKYAALGTSKGKRLRCLLQIESPSTVARALEALWDYRSAYQHHAGVTEGVKDAEPRFRALLHRVDDRAPPHSTETRSKQPIAASPSLEHLKGELLRITRLPPHERGYALEKFLKLVFDAHQLAARDPFRLVGEQIDGSFQLGSETYLVEAKWQGPLVGVAELHTFHGKLEQKAAWTRGLFVSVSGFSDDGLSAFGRGKRLICMDGLDLFDALERRLAVSEVIQRKVRRAAETGNPFARVRDLF